LKQKSGKGKYGWSDQRAMKVACFRRVIRQWILVLPCWLERKRQVADKGIEKILSVLLTLKTLSLIEIRASSST